MKVSHKKQTEKVKGILYTLKTMNGKPFSFEEIKVGSTYKNAITNAGLFHMNKGIVQWTHPNGISDSIINKIISEAQEKGREYNKRHTEKMTELPLPVTEEYSRVVSAEQDQLNRIENKLEQLLNALL